MEGIYQLMKDQIFILNVLEMIHNGLLENDQHQIMLGIEKKTSQRIRITSPFRISTEIIEGNRKSLLIIQKMDITLIGPYLCQTNQSVSTIILQLTSRKIIIIKKKEIVEIFL